MEDPRVRGNRLGWAWVVALALVVGAVLSQPTNSSYWDVRAKFLMEEASRAVGSKINLTAEEVVVNDMLMGAKMREVGPAFFGQNPFLPSRHFFDAKEDIERSQVFRFIKDLPKGAALHGHDTSMASLGYVVANLTYRPDLYGCVTNEARLSLHALRFSTGYPPPSADCEWLALDEMRSSNGAEEVDRWLGEELSLVTADPNEKYPNVDVVWDYFNRIFARIDGLITYKPVFVDYYKRILAELRDDNVIYLEIRGTLPKLYDLEGNQWEGPEVLKVYKEATDEFMKDNKEDFFGARFIYGPIKVGNVSAMDEYIQTVQTLHAQFPDFLAGFDLVGQEDKAPPLYNFVDKFLTLPPTLKFFFHAGETNWQGLTDVNLVDAILLNTSRIGHGYAIVKHPLVMQMARDKGVAVEVNPISNQVLRLVDDLRNHPAAMLLADDFPVVVSCDDPCFWNATGLSHDFYETFMGLADVNADLRLLKQLALNSISYSSMPEDEKRQALILWTRKWNKFIGETIKKYNLGAGILTNEV